MWHRRPQWITWQWGVILPPFLNCLSDLHFLTCWRGSLQFCIGLITTSITFYTGLLFVLCLCNKKHVRRHFVLNTHISKRQTCTHQGAPSNSLHGNNNTLAESAQRSRTQWRVDNEPCCHTHWGKFIKGQTVILWDKHAVAWYSTKPSRGIAPERGVRRLRFII